MSRIEAQMWEALKQVEDPELPVSIVDLGLIVALTYDSSTKTAHTKLTFTAMGCPAMDFIQDDVRYALFGVADVEHVEIEVVWDPMWTKDRIRANAREQMRALGIVV